MWAPRAKHVALVQAVCGEQSSLQTGDADPLTACDEEGKMARKGTGFVGAGELPPDSEDEETFSKTCTVRLGGD